MLNLIIRIYETNDFTTAMLCNFGSYRAKYIKGLVS